MDPCDHHTRQYRSEWEGSISQGQHLRYQYPGIDQVAVVAGWALVILSPSELRVLPISGCDIQNNDVWPAPSDVRTDPV